MPAPPQTLETLQNNQARNCAAKSASPPPKTMPEIWRLAPDSPNMNINPPITMATSASDRAKGPVNVSSRLLAARSQGDWANASVGKRRRAVNTITLTRRVNLIAKPQGMEYLP